MGFIKSLEENNFFLLQQLNGVMTNKAGGRSLKGQKNQHAMRGIEDNNYFLSERMHNAKNAKAAGRNHHGGFYRDGPPASSGFGYP